MPKRVTPIITGETYHIFNRGVEKRSVFLTDGDHRRFYNTLIYYQNSNVTTRYSFRVRKSLAKEAKDNQKLIEIICFCLMPNHFHLLLKQLTDGGIATFLGRLTNSYTRYFNTKHKRVGHLFQAPYKAVRVETDEQFIHVSRYIHLNPFASGITRNLKTYQWSSYQEYLGVSPSGVCRSEEVLDLFPKPRRENYHKFVMDQADYARSLELIKHQLLD